MAMRQTTERRVAAGTEPLTGSYCLGLAGRDPGTTGRHLEELPSPPRLLETVPYEEPPSC